MSVSGQFLKYSILLISDLAPVPNSGIFFLNSTTLGSRRKSSRGLWLRERRGKSHRWSFRTTGPQRLVPVHDHRLASVMLLTTQEGRKNKITVFPLTENTNKQKRRPLFVYKTAVGITEVTGCQIKSVCNLKEQGYTTQSDTDALRCTNHSFKCAVIQSPDL